MVGAESSLGSAVGIDRRRLTIDIRRPTWTEEGQRPPPEKGVLFMSLGGDRTRLERRRRAQALIASAQCPMPQLGFLLEGRAVPERRRTKEKPLSTAARKAFGGEPTGRQIEALKVALETPDIALIQGPPGTGKTRTIAALQIRMSEIADDNAWSFRPVPPNELSARRRGERGKCNAGLRATRYQGGSETGPG